MFSIIYSLADTPSIDKVFLIVASYTLSLPRTYLPNRYPYPSLDRPSNPYTGNRKQGFNFRDKKP
jgi:hypothetical protein